MSEIEKLQNWLDEEKKKGLIDTKLFRNPEFEGKLDPEEAAREINAMLTGETVPDPELF